MKVTSYETTVVQVPYEGPRTAYHILLQLRTDEGLEGFAFVTPLLPWARKALRSAIEAMAERVVGRNPMEVEGINKELLVRGSRVQFDGLARSAVSVVDSALWDLKAKAVGQPLYRLLGGTSNEIMCYAGWKLWFPYDIDTVAKHAAEHVAAGFRAMKFRLGVINNVGEALDRTRAIREAVGPDVQLHVDMNWQWTIDQTIRFGHEAQQYELFWIEDPIPYDDFDGLRHIRESIRTSVAVGEVYHEAAQFRTSLESRSVDIAIIDLEVGGVTQWMKMANIVQSYGRPVASHLCTELSTHVVAASGGIIVEYIPWAAPLFKEVPPVVDGKLILSDRPGFGLELDPAAVAKFKLS